MITDAKIGAHFFSTERSAEKCVKWLEEYTSKYKDKTDIKQIIGIDIYYYSANSETKDKYIFALERKEFGYFDKEYALKYPYCVEYIAIYK